MQFHNSGGALQQIGPDQIKSIVDPLGIGVRFGCPGCDEGVSR